MQMDRLPSHTLVICATNHPELLDRAMWRRFELKLEIERPDHDQLVAWFKRFEETLGSPSGISPEQFADYMSGENMSAVEAFTLDVRRKIVLSHGSLNPADAIRIVMKRGKLPVIKTNRECDDGNRLSNNSPEKKRRRQKD